MDIIQKILIELEHYFSVISLLFKHLRIFMLETTFTFTMYHLLILLVILMFVYWLKTSLGKLEMSREVGYKKSEIWNPFHRVPLEKHPYYFMGEITGIGTEVTRQKKKRELEEEEEGKRKLEQILLIKAERKKRLNVNFSGLSTPEKVGVINDEIKKFSPVRKLSLCRFCRATHGDFKEYEWSVGEASCSICTWGGDVINYSVIELVEQAKISLTDFYKCGGIRDINNENE